jgi:hypothetical protein
MLQRHHKPRKELCTDSVADYQRFIITSTCHDVRQLDLINSARNVSFLYIYLYTLFKLTRIFTLKLSVVEVSKEFEMEEIVFIHSHGESLLSKEKTRLFCKVKGVYQQQNATVITEE